jgi:hypothetical protein
MIGAVCCIHRLYVLYSLYRPQINEQDDKIHYVQYYVAVVFLLTSICASLNILPTDNK